MRPDEANGRSAATAATPAEAVPVETAPAGALATGSIPAGALLLGVALPVEAWLLAALIGDGVPGGALPWTLVHALASVVAALGTTLLVARLTPDRPRRVFALCLLLGASLPGIGALGTAGALLLGFRHAIGRHREEVYWQFTANPELPFTTPIGRAVDKLDSRGFAEQLVHGDDPDALYRKLLAVGRIRSSLSIDALASAVRHPDERIRLTAYQTLDRKVSGLNEEIQRLERAAAGSAGREQSDIWLQIASNYWELLTLEQGEPVAREQLLGKAAEAALRAVVVRPENRNAHFTYGLISLRQGEPARARVAFERATELGMPEEKTMPYLAEAAFDARELHRVRPLLERVDEAFLAYPPLREVAAQWR